MSLQSAFEAVTRAITRAAQRLTDDSDVFACGQCDRNVHCGMPPRRDCPHRLLLIEEARQYPSRPARWPAGPFGIQ